MKTITLDYETYRRELRDAKDEGFDLTGGLLDTLREIHIKLDSYDLEEFESARRKLWEIIVAVSKVKE